MERKSLHLVLLPFSFCEERILIIPLITSYVPVSIKAVAVAVLLVVVVVAAVMISL